MAHSYTWDDANFNQQPTDADLIGQMADEIRSTRQAIQERVKDEHNFALADNARQGSHKQGSARAWTGTSDPASPVPDQATDETNLNTGRLRMDTANGRIHAHDGTSWVEMTAEAATALKIPVRNADGEVLTATPDSGSPATAAATKDYVDTESADIRADALAIITELMDATVPVGFTYVQYPGTAAPNTSTLWPNGAVGSTGYTRNWTWTEITDKYAGLFFRAAGGNAGAFEEHIDDVAGTAQADEVKAHTHAVSAMTVKGSVEDGSGATTGVRMTQKDSPPDYNLASYGLAVTVDQTGGLETRPVNATIRVWRRTA